MSSNRYPTDLSDAEWSLLKPHLPAPKRRGRPRLHNPREILNAVFYVLKTGCQWRMLPCEFPPWKTVFHYFRRWRVNGTWERMNREMRRRLRKELGRHPEPRAGIVDSQSVKTTGVGGEARGFDGGKKVRGMKRHILVDTEGLVVEARVHSAKVPDQGGIKRLLEPARDRAGHDHQPVAVGEPAGIAGGEGVALPVAHRLYPPIPAAAKAAPYQYSEGRRTQVLDLLASVMIHALPPGVS